MSTETFSFKDYSLSPVDMIPPDDADADTDAWADYCLEAAHVDRQHVLDCVLSSLDTDDSPLYALIDTAMKDPHEPGRARESITVLAALGQAILNKVAAAVDDLTNMRLTIGGA